MKKLLSILLVVVLMITVLPLSVFEFKASAETSGTTGDCTWTLDGTVLTISGNGYMDEYGAVAGVAAPWGTSITKLIIENGVTEIGIGAFEDCDNLTSITIPNSVTIIGGNAFYGCSSLESITIPNSVTNIGKSAFHSCSSLTNITLPNSVTTINPYAFEGCSSLADVCYIGTSVDRKNIWIGSHNTYLINATWYYKAMGTTGDCTWTLDGTVLTISGNGEMGEYGEVGSATPWGYDLTNVIIKDGVTSIGANAFRSCSSLTSITIPNSVTSIGSNAFSNCTSLASITIPNSVTSIGSSAFYNTGYYNNADNWEHNVLYIGNHLIEAETSISGSYEINPGTIVIANSAFSSCSNLTSITIPDSITSIGKSAFIYCPNLENVYITDMAAWYNIDFYGDQANPLYCADFLFLNNKPVTNVVVPEGVTEITPYMFDFCTLKKIILPEGVTTIGYRAFASCEILTDINIPKSVTSIDEQAFYDCQSLKNVYITDIEAWCNIDFSYPTNLIYEGMYSSNPLYYADCLYVNGELITELTIPKSVTEIKSYMFSCSNLKRVNLHNNVTKISDYAFKDCTGLESFSLPSTVTNVGNSAFENCTGLKSVFINKNLMIIKRGAFNNCNNITEVYYEGSEEDWESVAILLNNGSLANADVIFNAKGLPVAIILGDIDGDEKVNLNDLVTLAQYTAGWKNLMVNETALDINGGGVVDLNDVIYFARYLAGWENYSLSPTPSVPDGWTGDYIIK